MDNGGVLVGLCLFLFFISFALLCAVRLPCGSFVPLAPDHKIVWTRTLMHANTMVTGRTPDLYFKNSSEYAISYMQVS